MNISIFGGGAWGSTLAQVLSDNGHDVLIYEVNNEYIEKINKHIHPVYHVTIPSNISSTNNLAQVVEFSNVYILAVPVVYMRGLVKMINSFLSKRIVLINVSKGMEADKLKTPSMIVEEEINAKWLEGFVTLTGPSHAEEVILRRVTLLTLACSSVKTLNLIQPILSNNYIRIYISTDVVGCEIGGIVKNAIAVASGILNGMNMGENARAALITRGMVEIARVIEFYGGQKASVYGLSGLGDLIVTASSQLSRNFKAGVRIGAGDSLETIYKEQKETIEGIKTIEALHKVSLNNGIDLPIINASYDVIFNNVSKNKALVDLLSRDIKYEV